MKTNFKLTLLVLCSVATLSLSACKKEPMAQPDPTPAPGGNPPAQNYASCNSEAECLNLSDDGLMKALRDRGAGRCKVLNRGGTSTLYSLQFDGAAWIAAYGNSYNVTDSYDQGAVYSYGEIARFARSAITDHQCFYPAQPKNYSFPQLWAAATKNQLGACKVALRGGSTNRYSMYLGSSVAKRSGNGIMITDVYDQSAVSSASDIAFTLAIAVELPTSQNGCF